ncbi:DUF1385 domain-containing protein [Caldicellulosiruptoraceae bacterium PP1]
MKKKTSIGGQALIEGIMMKGPEKVSMAVRKADGTIFIETNALSLKDQNKIKKIPFIRGTIILFEQLIMGTKMLMRSADIAMEDLSEEEKEAQKDWVDKLFEKKFFKDFGITDLAIYVSLVISLFFGLFLFLYLPTQSVKLFEQFSNNVLIKNLIEGIVRLIIFFIYLILISQMKDIKRVFEYHGAEHKTIYAYENGLELTVENVRKFSTLHPRCGTSFLLIVIIISIIVFSFAGWQGVLMRVLLRLLLLPVVVGISYEIIKWSGRSESKIAKLISIPGMLLQKITTKEPDDLQIEVAIAAIKEVITEDSELDRW